MRILLVDDDFGLSSQVKISLAAQKYEIETAADGEKALDRLFDGSYDLILLDILLPKRSGLEVLKEIRAAGIKTPVIMLTAKGSVNDRVAGLDSGADDYLPKPFAMSELLARIRSLLRRAGGQEAAILSVGEIVLDTIKREVMVGTCVLNLTQKEFLILEFLFHNKNRTVSRFHLAEHVWGDAFDPFNMSNFIDVHIKNLRKKISAAGSPDIIETVWGIGFTIKDEPL